uniref:protein-tyrosine-phosphatase n=1 Tax=Strongyloides papillosus TaxID=174720 RepID=A0A0N5C9E1_STREA
MRRSHSQIAQGRHMVNSNLDKHNGIEQDTRKHSLCRESCGAMCLETGHIQVYLKNNDSKISLDDELPSERCNKHTPSFGSEIQSTSLDKNKWYDGIKIEFQKKNENRREKVDKFMDIWQNSIVSNSAVSLRLCDNEDEQTPEDKVSLITAIGRRNVHEKELMINSLKDEDNLINFETLTIDDIKKNDIKPIILTTTIEKNNNYQKPTISKPRNRYMNEIVWQVDETVYCGGIEAVSNLNLLCRLNIEYIVDLSGFDEELSSRRSECPCLCSRKTPHSRMIMAIKLNDEVTLPKQNLMPFFEDVVKLINRAKVCRKCVLIHSVKGRNRAPAFVAAYMMHQHHITRVQAVAKISDLTSKIRPGINISDNLQRALMKWQSLQGIRSQDIHLDAKLFTPLFTVKKTAWT